MWLVHKLEEASIPYMVDLIKEMQNDSVKSLGKAIVGKVTTIETFCSCKDLTDIKGKGSWCVLIGHGQSQQRILPG
eukprot:scaffold408545_cov53-Prasinocladus_malaysianus.AAC.1